VRGNCLSILGFRVLRTKDYEGLAGTLEDDDLAIQYQTLETSSRVITRFLSTMRSSERVYLEMRTEHNLMSQTTCREL
jgi:hypothetical protein